MSDLVCIYCRVSSDEQVQGTSLGSQEAACRAFAEHMLSDLATIWERASTMDRLRFERAIFPDGITWSRCEGVRTAVSASVFSAIQSRRSDKSEVAPPTGCSSNQRPFEQFLAAVWSIRDLNVKAA